MHLCYNAQTNEGKIQKTLKKGEKKMNEDEIFQIYNLLSLIFVEKYYDEDDVRECKKLLRKATKAIEK